MSHVHLGHKIPWGDLIECTRPPDPSEILLPIGECSRIHIIDKATKIKVENRKKYISENDICTLKNCQTIGTKSFSKGKILPYELHPKRTSKSPEIMKKIIYFSKKLTDAVIEFGDTEKNKVNTNSEVILHENLELYSVNILKSFGLSSYFYNNPDKNDKIVLALFLKGDVRNLLKLNESGEINILRAFRTLYGGQAVGRGFEFLMDYRVIPFYLAANAIIAAGYQSDKTKWGLLSDDYFYRELLWDCDFLTFIPHLRPYLDENVFMVDLQKTDELLKECFKFIFIYLLLYRIVYDANYEELLRHLQKYVEHAL